MTRPRNPAAALASRVAVIEIITTFCTKPATSSVSAPALTLRRCAKPSNSAYQIAVPTSAARSGRRVPPVSTIVTDARRPPIAKLATSQPRPVASAS